MGKLEDLEKNIERIIEFMVEAHGECEDCKSFIDVWNYWSKEQDEEYNLCGYCARKYDHIEKRFSSGTRNKREY